MDKTILSHWYTRLDTFSYSTQQFYERLCAEISRRQMPEVKILRVSLPESSILSASRDYLRLTRGELTFDLCAAPFGIDFFVSWWLIEQPGCMSGCVTAVMPWLAIFARRWTYWKEDSAIIFRDAVHQCILETIDAMMKDAGKTFEGDRKPVSRTHLI